jgi:hypothetical protein
MAVGMDILVDTLHEKDADEYEEMLLSIETSMLYASFKYRQFLKHILVNSTPVYLIARQNKEIIGTLPAFICNNEVYGCVLNSLPFYGSNGGILVSTKASNPSAVRNELLQAFNALARTRNVAVSTIISSPFDSNIDFYEANTGFTLRDERIGQITTLPRNCSDAYKLKMELFNSFHKNTRTSIRKAEKSDLVIKHSDRLDVLEKLAVLHKENIESVGGVAKPWSIFLAIREAFNYDQDYRIYTAERNGCLIAALLVFFYNRTAEYFTPVTLESARIYQPMSLLIFEAMQEAVKRNIVYWNWGGTWLTQNGVYNFKSRWGTKDNPYYYYIREYDRSNVLRDLTSGQIRVEFPYFYVLPFNLLQKERG